MNKEFPATLTDTTGLEEVKGIIKLIDRTLTGTLLFLNSGVGLTEPLSRENKPTYQSVGAYSANYFRQGPRFTYTQLHLPPNTLDQPPHCHPGGEIALVLAGEYFDADMQGNPLRTYKQGSRIFYPKGSTHRPLSHTGADIDYTTFDGIVFGENLVDLMGKMERLPKIDDQALEFAILWMVPDPEERRLLQIRFLGGL